MMTFLKERGKKISISFFSFFSLSFFLSLSLNLKKKTTLSLSLSFLSSLSLSLPNQIPLSLSLPLFFYLNLAATSLYLGSAAMSPRAAIDSGVAVAFLTAAHIDAGVSALIASTNSATGLRLP